MVFLEGVFPFIRGMLNNLVVAAIILLIGFIVGRLMGRFVGRFLSEIEVNKMISSSVRVSIPADEIVGSIVMFLIYFLTVALAVDTLNLEDLLFNIIAILIIIIILASVTLSLVDFVRNFFSGIFLHQKGIIQIGDIIRAGGLEGKIIRIDLVDTRLETREGDLIFVPNTLLVKNIVLVKKRKRS
ncbi:mechanosensitive ion channel [Candidatus Woesearchaeota archaeon]|nr:mechanosensitive ion channel [Candidatus Woesearchaeota archaeon]